MSAAEPDARPVRASDAAPNPTSGAAASLVRLRRCVADFGALLASTEDEATILEQGSKHLAALVAEDDWLPEEYAAADAVRYRQYLLHCDSRERFSIVSFVWGPGQSTPVHDHRVWGLVGVLRGAELNQAFERVVAADGGGRLVPHGEPQRLAPGAVTAVSPAIGDLHQVANAFRDRVSISIHVYGGNIGAVERAIYDAEARPQRFVSGYANEHLPNFWRAT
jgi:predicted metal-dependent enzyme (double-stranded beta helix superfamily)